MGDLKRRKTLGWIRSLLVFLREQNLLCETGWKSRKKCALCENRVGLWRFVRSSSVEEQADGEHFLTLLPIPVMSQAGVGIVFFFFFTYFTRGKKKNKSLSDFSSSTQFGSLRAPWKWILLHRKPEDCAVGPHTTVSPPPSALTLLPPELAGVLHFPSLAIRPGVGCLLGVLANLFTLRGWPRGRGGPTSSGRKLPEPSVILQQKLCSRCWSTSPCPCLSKRHYRRLWTTHSKNTGLSGRLCCFPLSHVFIPI